MRRSPYEDYRRLQEKKAELEAFNKKEVENAFNKAIDAVKDVASDEVKASLNKAAQIYRAERQYLVQRAETTEHLAGVGLSVETASHDLMVAMGKSLTAIDRLLSEANRPGDLDKQKVVQELVMLRGSLSFIETQLKDIQLLFRSTKQRRRDLRVSDLLEKVVRLFVPTMDRAGIDVKIERGMVPLVAKTTEAVILQVLLNLFDNAVYWLEASEKPRQIEIRLDGEQGILTFADNGPGIREEDAPYLFEAFFSGKGQEGRGLGLYIARQLLQRHDYDISLITSPADKILKGANFQISFVREDNK
jgi:signal transduction histidine kinase